MQSMQHVQYVLDGYECMQHECIYVSACLGSEPLFHLHKYDRYQVTAALATLQDCTIRGGATSSSSRRTADPWWRFWVGESQCLIRANNGDGWWWAVIKSGSQGLIVVNNRKVQWFVAFYLYKMYHGIKKLQQPFSSPIGTPPFRTILLII